MKERLASREARKRGDRPQEGMRTQAFRPPPRPTFASSIFLVSSSSSVSEWLLQQWSRRRRLQTQGKARTAQSLGKQTRGFVRHRARDTLAVRAVQQRKGRGNSPLLVAFPESHSSELWSLSSSWSLVPSPSELPCVAVAVPLGLTSLCAEGCACTRVRVAPLSCMELMHENAGPAGRSPRHPTHCKAYISSRLPRLPSPCCPQHHQRRCPPLWCHHRPALQRVRLRRCWSPLWRCQLWCPGEQRCGPRAGRSQRLGSAPVRARTRVGTLDGGTTENACDGCEGRQRGC